MRVVYRDSSISEADALTVVAGLRGLGLHPTLYTATEEFWQWRVVVPDTEEERALGYLDGYYDTLENPGHEGGGREQNPSSGEYYDEALYLGNVSPVLVQSINAGYDISGPRAVYVHRYPKHGAHSRTEDQVRAEVRSCNRNGIEHAYATYTWTDATGKPQPYWVMAPVEAFEQFDPARKHNPRGRGRSGYVPFDPERDRVEHFTPRFVPASLMGELTNLYHLARVPLSGTGGGRYERLLWASKEFHKAHPEVSETGAYKDLDTSLAFSGFRNPVQNGRSYEVRGITPPRYWEPKGGDVVYIEGVRTKLGRPVVDSDGDTMFSFHPPVRGTTAMSVGNLKQVARLQDITVARAGNPVDSSNVGTPQNHPDWQGYLYNIGEPFKGRYYPRVMVPGGGSVHIQGEYHTPTEAFLGVQAWMDSSERMRFDVPRERKSNPRDTASARYEDFHGYPSEQITEFSEEEHYHSNLAQLGEMVEIIVATVTGKEATINFAGSGTQLASNEDGTSLYLIGGDMSLELDQLGIKGALAEKDSVVIGEILEMTYSTAKHFDADKRTGAPVRIDYFHRLGEETGENPTLVYDTLNRTLSIAGGAYSIESVGITN